MPRLRTGFTTRASCLLAAGLTAMLCGLILGEVDLLRAGVLAAVIPCVASVLVQRTQVRIASRRAVFPTQVASGDAVQVTLTITNGSPLPTGSLMLEDQLPDRLTGNARFVLDPLRAREVRTVSYRIPELARGHYRVGPLRVRLTDPFGMIDLTRSFSTVSDFSVAPIVDRLPTGTLPHADDLGDTGGSHSIGAHGADDASTREYRIGDDLRKIHWRSSARTGTMMVRQEERPWRGVTVVLLDLRAGAHVRAPADLVSAENMVRDASSAQRRDPRLDDSLEWAVSAAASIGTEVVRSQRHVSLVDDQFGRDAVRFDSADGLIGHLATVRGQRGDDLAELIAQGRRAARDSAVVAILGRLDRTALDQLGAIPRRRGSRALSALLLDVDGWAAPEPTADAAARVPGTGWIPTDAAAGLLRNGGWRVTVVRRGDSLPASWRSLVATATPGVRA